MILFVVLKSSGLAYSANQARSRNSPRPVGARIHQFQLEQFQPSVTAVSYTSLTWDMPKGQHPRVCTSLVTCYALLFYILSISIRQNAFKLTLNIFTKSSNPSPKSITSVTFLQFDYITGNKIFCIFLRL